MAVLEERTINPFFIFLFWGVSCAAIFNNGYYHPIMWIIGLVFALLSFLLRRFSLDEIDVVLLLWLSWLAFGLIFSVNRSNTLQEILLFLIYLLAFELTRRGLNSQKRQELFLLFCILGAFFGLGGILDFLLVTHNRISFTFINPNSFGIYMAMLSLLSLANLAKSSRPYLSGVGVVFSFTALLLSGSRGSVIAFAIALLLLGWGLNLLAKKEILMRYFFSLTGAVLLTYFLTFIVQSSIGQMLIRPESFVSSSLEGRLIFWQVAVREFFAFPLTGVGAGNFHLPYHLFSPGGFWYSRFTHNHYLQVLAEEGIFGLLIFLLFIFLVLRKLPALKTQNPSFLFWGAISASCCFLLHCGIDFSWNMPAVTLLFFVLLGLLLPLEKEVFIFNEPSKLTTILMQIVAVFCLFLALQSCVVFYLKQEAIRLVAAGQLEEAYDREKIALRFHPWQDEVADSLSRKTELLEKKDEALAYARKAYTLSPYSWRYASHYGVLLWQKEEPQAEEYLTKATHLAGFLPQPYASLGFYYLEQGNKAKAEEVFKKGLELFPDALKNAQNSGRGEQAEPWDDLLIDGLKKAES